MRFRDIFIVARGTKVILAITISVTAAALCFAYFYYSSINRSEDPRTKRARLLLNEFEKPGVHNDFDSFAILDSALIIFNQYPDYNQSFETGIIYNNKCSSLLLKALYDSTISPNEKTTLLELSMQYCDSGIMIYNTWIKEWGDLTEDQMGSRLISMIDRNDEIFNGYDYDKILRRRISNLVMAQTETPRRLSVSLSNKGTIFRHLSMPDSALQCFNLALELWKENRTAESNRSVLIGGEPVRPNLIESLFPPDRKKK